MKYTSSEANKLLKKLNSDYQNILFTESQSKTFLAATGEDPESVKPAYDFAKTQEEIKAITKKIRTVKHAINQFNTTTVVDGFDMTIDEMLVYLPQMTERVNVLNEMRGMIPKTRERSYGSGTNATIDYKYANYDIEDAEKAYQECYDLISKAQSALDLVNNTASIEIDI